MRRSVLLYFCITKYVLLLPLYSLYFFHMLHIKRVSKLIKFTQCNFAHHVFCCLLEHFMPFSGFYICLGVVAVQLPGNSTLSLGVFLYQIYSRLGSKAVYLIFLDMRWQLLRIRVSHSCSPQSLRRAGAPLRGIWCWLRMPIVYRRRCA